MGEVYRAKGTPVGALSYAYHRQRLEAQLGWDYDVASDGRFLINTELVSAAARLALLMNWHPAAKK